MKTPIKETTLPSTSQYDFYKVITPDYDADFTYEPSHGKVTAACSKMHALLDRTLEEVYAIAWREGWLIRRSR